MYVPQVRSNDTACQLVRLSTCQCPYPLRRPQNATRHLDQISWPALINACSSQAATKLLRTRTTESFVEFIAPVSPLLIRPPWSHELRNRLLLLLVVFGCLVFSCAATCIVTLYSLGQGDLRRTCTHSASTRAKKKGSGYPGQFPT